ncbi:MAG: UDP-3-O-acyl-N-acetylglucosamine deacetylase [Parvularculaceae bacterium]
MRYLSGAARKGTVRGMRLISQTTVMRPASVEGVGLHSGVHARATLRPAGAGQGVVFRRRVSGDGPAREIAALPDAVSNTHFNTGVGDAETRIATVEHLMAAIALAGIDNLVVDVDGPELPALDGSAALYLQALVEAGVRDLPAPRELIRILAPIEIVEGDGRSIRAEPHEGRIIDVSIEFPDAAIGAQRAVVDLDNPADVRRVAAARTFCRRADIDRLRALGLSLGGSLDNAIVVDGAAILNPAGLRDPQEFALHKALDLIGDLRLAGAPIIGRVVANRPGHDLNARFLAALSAGGNAVARGSEDAVKRRASA